MEGSSILEAPLVNIPRDATFQDWRVIKELTKRALLLVELERIKEMGSYMLRRISVTIMHQVPSQLVLVLLHMFFFPFLTFYLHAARISLLP